MSNKLLAVAVGSFLALGAWLLLTGPDEPDGPSPAEDSPSVAPTSQPERTFSPEATPSAPDQSAEPTTRDPEDLAADRVAAAEDAVRAFARPASGVSAEQWRAEFQPFISARYAEDFAYIDPREVPYTQVKGAGRAVETDAPGTLLTLVRVPTDAGSFAVEVEDTEDGPKAMAIYPWDSRE